jgi:nitrite reductase (NO-forming)
MSSDSSYGNKKTRKMMIYSILIATAILGSIIPLSGLISMDMDNEIKGASEAEATVISNSTTNTSKELTLVAEDAELEIAPGKVVKTWTFNGTMPAPTLRFTEGENVTIKFINKTPVPHTIHFHGHHDDINDGVYPQIMPNETYLYNITAVPAGALMYHCHAYPTSLHIRMGMYGALIVDPKDYTLPPAKEYFMVMSEFDTHDIMKFEAEYYPINGYVDQYVHNPIELNHGELLRLYVMNIGTTIPAQFHLHSATFKAYPSGLLSNEPIDAQTIPVGPGDATIIEAQWEYPGTYLFHAHGFQEERGNMGQIVVAEPGENDNNQPTASNETGSISMFDWQFELQKSLQNPIIINYSDAELGEVQEIAEHDGHGIVHDNTTTFTQPTTNASGTTIPRDESMNENDGDNATPTSHEISIVEGSVNPSSAIFYDPSPATVKRGDTVIWINDDSVPHTSTSGTLGGEEQTGISSFDTGIIGPDRSSSEIVIDAEPGTYDYYCTLHPYMIAQLTVED